jgi:hypothetical protein
MKPQTIIDLRNEMLIAYNNHRIGKLDNDTLKQKANMEGKIMGTAKLEIEHQRLVKTNVAIPFLTSPEVLKSLNEKK